LHILHRYFGFHLIRFHITWPDKSWSPWSHYIILQNYLNLF
jgi:hypothetical protein